MSNRFWASSGDMSGDSVDSSIEASDASRDSPYKPGDWESRDGNSRDDASRAVVARTNNVAAGLADLEPHQRANLFYLSLVEGRCRTQALANINAKRGNLSRHMFDEVKRELHKAGMLSAEFVDQDLPQLNQYLSQFDNILGSIVGKEAHDLPRNVSRTITDVSNIRSVVANNSIFAASNAIVPSEFFTPQQDFPMVLQASFRTLLHHMYPAEYHAKDVCTGSIYATQYVQLSKLGSGGFGAVYKVRDKFDRAEYAIKKIVVKRKTLQRLYDQSTISELTSLVNEVQTLAKLSHNNIVRYHSCWMEPLPLDDDSRSTASDDSDEDSSCDGKGEDDEGNEGRLLRSRIKTMSLSEHEQELQRDIQFQLNNDHSEIFSDSNPFNSNGQSKPSSNDRIVQEVDEDETEEIERPQDQLMKMSHKTTKYADFHLAMYIKMAPYPLSLHEYIHHDSASWFAAHPNVPHITHCHHVLPTINLLLLILDGVEYIHRKKVIHRDLKPANILLQMLDPGDKPTTEYVNMNHCPQCGDGGKEKDIWISPRIADFGLIHDLSTQSTNPPPTTTTTSSFSSQTKPNKKPQPALGTPAYLPPHHTSTSPICPKLDIYSLGIIAFEMLYKFNTSSERARVLDELKISGKVPESFEGCVLKECVLGMIRKDVGERWNGESVRRELMRVRELVLGGDEEV